MHLIITKHSGSLHYPLDTLKTQYQSAPDETYKGILNAYANLMGEEGPGVLFRGTGPAMLRSFDIAYRDISIP